MEQISESVTMSCSPSEHKSIRSSGQSENGASQVATSTSGCVPMARRITLRPSCSRASLMVINPCFTNAMVAEWSSVIR